MVQDYLDTHTLRVQSGREQLCRLWAGFRVFLPARERSRWTRCRFIGELRAAGVPVGIGEDGRAWCGGIVMATASRWIETERGQLALAVA